ncbi:MAG: hypothetical protein PHN69_05240 [Candidatus Pacebacteria bacterium]|nr:hypothetical protein [Candidatus Paceibacterota bacterium]
MRQLSDKEMELVALISEEAVLYALEKFKDKRVANIPMKYAG